ncbi:MAG: hypothetical protein AB1801_12885, partial [Chloroflexota bacterium]
PTNLWETGEVVIDDITLSLADVPPGEYTPVVGLYDLTSGVRLAVPGAPNNEVTLPSVQIGHGE